MVATEGPGPKRHCYDTYLPVLSLRDGLASDEHSPLLGAGTRSNKEERLAWMCRNATSFWLGYYTRQVVVSWSSGSHDGTDCLLLLETLSSLNLPSSCLLLSSFPCLFLFLVHPSIHSLSQICCTPPCARSCLNKIQTHSSRYMRRGYTRASHPAGDGGVRGGCQEHGPLG